MVAKRYRAEGQQVGEYGLVLALFAVSLVVTLTFFGETISHSIQSMVAGMNKPAPGPLLAATPDEKAAESLSLSSSLAQGSGMAMTYTDTMTGVTETTGANGATELMTDQLLDIGKQELAAGEITEEQYNVFTRLANAGHEMASVEAMIESAANNAGSYDEFMNTPVVYRGQKMTVGRLTDYIGTTREMDHSDPLSYRSKPSQVLEEFISAYNDLEGSGALKKPDIKEKVSFLSKKIALLNGLFDDTRLKLQIQPEYSAKSLKELAAPYISSLKSKDICSTGGNDCNK